VLCGDFNCEPDSLEHRRMQAPIAADVPAWRDAWRTISPASPHEPSVGLHGAEWPDHAYCCDFFFVTEDLAPRVRGLHVISATAASDHQPVLLELGD
jgi:endonuclease/exonuclease/phosphatase family metal-dependent hydrolase